MAEWLHDAQYSLVLFTLFTQASVGAFWVLLVNDFLKRQAPDEIQDAFTRVGTALLVPLTAVGLVFSTTHLGRPQYAFRALAHIGSSWLSREVWAFGLFFGLVAIYTFIWWRRVGDAELRRLVGVVTGIVGLLGILSQAMVYQIPGRPMWNHGSTLALFGVSALILGPLAVATVYSAAWGRTIDLARGEATVRRAHRRLGITLVAGAAAYGVALLARIGHLTGEGIGASLARLWPGPVAHAAGSAAGLPAAVAGRAAFGKETIQTALLLGQERMAEYAWMLNLQVILGIGVPVLLAVLLWYLHQQKASLRLCNGLIAGGLVLVLGGEMAGRALFYLTGRPWF